MDFQWVVEFYKALSGISQGLLAIVTAVIATYIAVKRHLLEKVKWRMQLYNQRYKIFLTVAELIAAILQMSTVADEGLHNYLRDSRDKSFFVA